MDFFPVYSYFTSRDIDYGELTFPDQFNKSALPGLLLMRISDIKKEIHGFSTGRSFISDIFWMDQPITP